MSLGIVCFLMRELEENPEIRLSSANEKLENPFNYKLDHKKYCDV